MIGDRVELAGGYALVPDEDGVWIPVFGIAARITDRANAERFGEVMAQGGQSPRGEARSEAGAAERTGRPERSIQRDAGACPPPP